MYQQISQDNFQISLKITDTESCLNIDLNTPCLLLRCMVLILKLLSFFQVLFFLPFYDWGQNNKRLEQIRTFTKVGTDIEFLSNC